MSKIFEILNKNGGEVADLIRPLFDGQNAPAPQDGANHQVAAPVPAQQPPPVQVAVSNGHEPSQVAVSNGHEPLQTRIRTLNLRVPAPSPLLPFEDSHLLASEQYRILRTKITHHPRQPRLIVISSADSGDGKSVTAINTAAALSLKSDAPSLLLDGDLRKSAAHLQLGLPQSPGLSDVLQGGSTLDQALIRTEEYSNLYVLPAGAVLANPAELLDSPQWRTLCAKLRKMFRFVMIDSPPVAAVADYELIQAVCDAVILVARPDHTNRALLKKAVETVPKEKLLGVLLNCVPKWPLARYSGGGHYYYQYPYSGSAPKGKNEPPPVPAKE